MNSNLKLLLGAAVGGGLGWFVGSVIVEILILKEHNDEWAVEDDYHETDESSHEADENQLFERHKGMGKKKVRNYTEAFQQNPDLKKLVEKYNGNTDEVMTGDPDAEEPKGELDASDDFSEYDYHEEDDTPIISIISMAEFAGAEGFETVTLNYYDDDVVTDPKDQVIQNPEKILGEEALVSFGELSEDPDVVYVKNLETNTMYEIVRTNKNHGVEMIRRKRRENIARQQARMKEEQDGEANITP